MCDNNIPPLPNLKCNGEIKGYFLIPKTDIKEIKNGVVKIKRKYGEFQRNNIKFFKSIRND